MKLPKIEKTGCCCGLIIFGVIFIFVYTIYINTFEKSRKNSLITAGKVIPGADWVVRWGGYEFDWGQTVEVDDSGNIYVLGGFKGLADFVPGFGIDKNYSPNHDAIFLSRFDSRGRRTWTHTWEQDGGDEDYRDDASGLAFDNNGLVYAVGYAARLRMFGLDGDRMESCFDNVLGNSLVFDSTGNLYAAWLERDSFRISIRKFNVSGDLQWEVEPPDQEGIYTGGDFVIDYDDNLYLGYEALTKYDQDGELIWHLDMPGTIQGLDLDDSGNVFAGGWMLGFCGSSLITGEDPELEANKDKSFLYKVSPDGELFWSVTWESWIRSVACATDGNIYVTGRFKRSRDFDPGPQECIRSSASGSHGYTHSIFLSSFNSEGDFQWVRTGGEWSAGIDVEVDDSGYIYLTGYTFGDAFLAKFAPEE